jgi:hypothetical protein
MAFVPWRTRFNRKPNTVRRRARPGVLQLEDRWLLSVLVAVDAGLNQHAINPNIYGVNAADTAALKDLNVPFNRQGGNLATRYNWQLNAFNHSRDFFFESIGEGGNPGGVADTFVANTQAAGAQPSLTIPTLGWVAKLGPNGEKLASFSVAKYGPQQQTDQFFPDAGNGVLPGGNANTGPFVVGNDPNDANVPSDPAFQQGWVQHLTGKWGTADKGGVGYYALDNEPGLWHDSHRDVHPTGATMQEVRNDLVNYGGMVKANDPAALTMGPEEWGYFGYFYSGSDKQYSDQHGNTLDNLPDRTANNNMDYIPFLLDGLAKNAAANNGKRLLDVLTVHFYPQAGEDGTDVSRNMQLLRNRSTRSLWDPNYVDESWLSNLPDNKVDLVPRLKSWVATYYPGTQTGITEYDWGADNHINGATTQADILGIFGREGLDLANRFEEASSGGPQDGSGAATLGTPVANAFKMYRNYDGRNSTFGDTSVSATVPDPDQVSAFASLRSSDGALTVMVINKNLYDPSNPGATTSVTVSLGNFGSDGVAESWRLQAVNPAVSMTNSTIVHGPDVHFAGTSFTVALPMQSVQLFVFHPAPIQFSAAAYRVAETDGTASITVTRGGRLDTPATVHYATSNGTALDGADYTATSGDLSFAAGEASKSFTVPILADQGADDGTDTVNLTLSNPVGGVLGQATAVLTITNDDPVLTPIAEETAQPAGNTVGSLLAGVFSDPDPGALRGIAVVGADDGHGSWQYSLNAGLTWQAVATVADADALLLRDTDKLRFVPGPNFVGTATIDYRAWDRTIGTAGHTADLTALGTGDRTAFSVAVENASITVTPVNDQPVLDTRPTPALAPLAGTEDAPAGSTVASLLGSAVSDPDGPAQGIAVVAADNTHGTWQFSADGGQTWKPIPAVSVAAALLLRDTDLVGYVPRSPFVGTATLRYRAWDQSAGVAGKLSNTALGTTFSTAIGTAYVSVGNTAPVLDTSGSPALSPIAEDATQPAGNTVASLLVGAVSDPDPGALLGIAVTSVDNSHGIWQYSLNGGLTWQNLGAASATAALLLRDTDKLRFVPVPNFSGTATISYRAWDRTVGAAGGLADLTALGSGGRTAFSTATQTASITVTFVNDAPALDTRPTAALAPLAGTENAPVGSTVASLLANAFSDVDGPAQGIAVVAADNSRGTWLFSSDGGQTWKPIPTVSVLAALLLRDTDLVAYVPRSPFVGTATLRYRAWDQSVGTVGATANTGLGTAFSLAIGTAYVSVGNQAPVLDTSGSPTLTPIAEDSTQPPGNAVASLLGKAVTDANAGALHGIALTAADNGHGAWQYSLNGGLTWQNVGAASASAALLLRDIDKLRFVPAPDFSGTAMVSYKAWNRTVGAAGGIADLTAVGSGGRTAFSTATQTASITVTFVNDRPVLATQGTSALTPLAPDDTNSAGNTVASLLGSAFSDVDGPARGIAVIGTDNTHGTWQYSTDGGQTWLAFGLPTVVAARLLRDTDLVRFVPAVGFKGSATLRYKAWDQSGGTAGTSANSALGTAFSLEIATAFVSVGNQAPVFA